MSRHRGSEDDREKVREQVALVQLVDDNVRQRGQHAVRAGGREAPQQHPGVAAQVEPI